MIVYNKNDKFIKVSIPNMEYDSSNKDNHTVLYIVKSPEIICNNKKDAEYIKEKVNIFTMELIHKILNESEENHEQKTSKHTKSKSN